MTISSPRAATIGFPTAPLEWDDKKEWLRKLAEASNLLSDGKINATGTVTLTASQATTTLTDRRIGLNTKVFLTPTTANASAEIGAGAIYQTFPNTTEGQAVINHANNSQSDRAFGFALHG